MKASDVAKKYHHTLNKISELSIFADSLAGKIESTILKEVDKLELKKFLELLVFFKK